VGLNSIMATSAAGNAYGIILETYNNISDVNIYRNNLSSGIKGKYDAVGILLEAEGQIDDGSAGIDVFVTENRLKVSSTNTAFVAGTSPTHQYLVSGIHLEAFDYLLAEVSMNDLSLGVTGAGSSLPGVANTTRGVWGVSLVSMMSNIGRSSAAGDDCKIYNNLLTVTNSNGAATTTGAEGVHMLANSNTWASILYNTFKVKAYTNVAAGYISSSNIGVTNPVEFQYNTGTVDGTLATAAAERWLLSVDGGSGTVNWGGNFVSPVSKGWTGNWPVLAAPFTGTGPVEDNFGGTLNP